MWIIFYKRENYGADNWIVDFGKAEVDSYSEGVTYVSNLNKLAKLLDPTHQYVYHMVRCVPATMATTIGTEPCISEKLMLEKQLEI